MNVPNWEGLETSCSTRMGVIEGGDPSKVTIKIVEGFHLKSFSSLMATGETRTNWIKYVYFVLGRHSTYDEQP